MKQKQEIRSRTKDEADSTKWKWDLLYLSFYFRSGDDADRRCETRKSGPPPVDLLVFIFVLFYEKTRIKVRPGLPFDPLRTVVGVLPPEKG